MKPEAGRRLSSILLSKFNQYLIVFVVISLTALICRPLSNQESYHIVSFILLFIVSIMAVFLGIGPILLASTLSSLVWNFFFIPPHFAFHIEKTEDKLMFGSFFVIALLNGVLTNRIRRQEKLALEREHRTKAIFELTKNLFNASGSGQVIRMFIRDVQEYFDTGYIGIYRGGEGRPDNLITSDTDQQNVITADRGVAEWVLKNSMRAGRNTSNFSGDPLTYYPLTGKNRVQGVIAILFRNSLSNEEELFWIACLTQLSIALERESLAELALRARMLDESDRLYKTLFNLISHEFRIPIATIIGSSDTLLMPGTSDLNRTELLNEIYKASARLNHLIENLLNMSRLESGKISLRLDWCDINDLLNRVVKILGQQLDQHRLIIEVPSDMPLVRLDFGLMEQVFYNLILNACQHTPDGSVIWFRSSYSSGFVTFEVEDSGRGFPPDYLSRSFSKFHRAENKRSGGLGLGLSIVKGLVEAHRGQVKLENSEGSGAKCIISIPSDLPDINHINLDI